MAIQKALQVIRCLLLPVIIVSFTTRNSVAQTPYTFNQSAVPSRAAMPGSPNTASLGRFGDYQVNLFHGVPDISVPIYTIKTNKLELPVVLKYHASGIRVADVASWVGLGWALDAGGILSRMVKDIADESQYGYLTHPVQTPITPVTGYYTAGQLDTLNEYTNGWYDGEPDVFSYDLKGKSGSFIFDTSQAPVTIPNDNVKIISDIVNGRIDIFDPQGVQFRFGKSSAGQKANEFTSFVGKNGVSIAPPNAWMLMEMISPDRSDTIKFFYTERTYLTFDNYQDLVVIDEGTEDYRDDDGLIKTRYWSNQPVSAENIAANQQEQLLTEIRFKNGRILFDNTSRTDLAYLKALDKIRIERFDEALNAYLSVKNVKFHYSYFPGPRLKLDSVQFIDLLNKQVENRYTFGYNTTVQLPAYTSKSQDFWGYYNAKVNSTLIPRQEYASSVNANTFVVGGADRNPNANVMAANILTRISFPTGGKTEFEYEINKYDSSGTIIPVGGLRIKQISSYDGIAATPKIKRYKYGVKECGGGMLNYHDFYYRTDYEEEREPNLGCLAYHRWVKTFSVDPSLIRRGTDGSIVSYTEVAEYDGPDDNAGKTVYKYSYKSDQILRFILHSPKIYALDNSRSRGQLKQKDVWDKNGHHLYNLTNTYTDYGTVYMHNAGFFAYRHKKITCTTTPAIYEMKNYYITDSWIRLSHSEETQYDPEDTSQSVTTVTDYSYSPNNYEVSKRISTNAAQKKIIDSFTYPLDYTITGTPGNAVASGIKNLQDKNVVTAIVEKTTSQTDLAGNNLRLLGGTLITYKATTPVPDIAYQLNTPSRLTSFTKAVITASSFSKDPAYESRLVFDSYDANGNVTQQHSTDNFPESFIWEYNNGYPVAVVKNAALIDIAYTSFETGSKGSWNFSGDGQLSSGSPTGRRTYTLTGNITRSGLSTTKTYLVSYWRKNSSPAITVNGTAGVAGKVSGDYTYYQHQITNPASGIITLVGTNAIIDELRLYPAGARMSTLTFDALVGITSECSPDNSIKYYEYDEFQRLIVIRDADWNIIKRVIYKYEGNPEHPNAFYNVTRTKSYKSNITCNGCLVSNYVSLTVPANMFISTNSPEDANARADAYLDSVGPAYARANGACVNPPVAAVQASNRMGLSFQVTFSNNCTNFNYSFTIDPRASFTPLPNIPEGTYNVSFSPLTSGTDTSTYGLGNGTNNPEDNFMLQGVRQGIMFNVTIRPALTTYILITP